MSNENIETIVEVNSNFVNESPNFECGNLIISVTPPIDENYWLFRVKLYKDQSIVAFPKFFTIGIGFAKEKACNTNLPFSTDADEIFNHIKYNKKYKKITKKQCIEAIKLIQEECKKVMDKEE